jgi:two-component system C4-dicarboxylate transport sensor histidine kinase DctB
LAEGLAVQGQVVRLEQVLVNLLRNGVDACRENGATQVSVRAALDDGWVAITVADSGPGIPPEAFARLFEPFFTTKQTGDGLGLGLAISGSIANALGGSLGAANRPQGGAEFTLRLRPADSPVHAAHASRTIG